MGLTAPTRWFRHAFAASRAGGDLSALQDRFSAFLVLLERNNQVLTTIADMEEKARGDHLFDANYVRASVTTIREGVESIIDRLMALGGPPYQPLRERYRRIDADIEALLLGTRRIPQDACTIAFDAVGRNRAFSVGYKNTQLGELKSQLGLPVPDGFAISAWAYKRFVDANDLQARITREIASVNLRAFEDLIRASAAIRSLIEASPVPPDVAEAITEASARLIASAPGVPRTVSLRSSAIGEDSVFSFAGQYELYLNVPLANVVSGYRAVLAGKFTPQAIYYFLSHALSESDLAMGVSCMLMVDAAVSGVLYTRDPVHSSDAAVVVSAIYGLGKLLVDGTLAPDVFRVSRDGAVLSADLVRKPVRLIMHATEGTTVEPVPEPLQRAASLTDAQLRALAECAEVIEAHCGCPQDIEWAIDRAGRLFLLQSRPLRIVPARPDRPAPDLTGRECIRQGGVTVSPGAGAGPLHVVSSPGDLGTVPPGAVVVATNPFAGLATILDHISALVLETGGVASHLATLAREGQVPALGGVAGATTLPVGETVTVDATACAIYRGAIPELVEARRLLPELIEDSAVFTLLDRTLSKIAPLNLRHPSDPGFTAEACQTIHDITRFAHQRAMEEIFSRATTIEHKERLGVRLETAIPLDVYILCLDRPLGTAGECRTIKEDEILSAPMRAFWDGVKREGWVSHALSPTAGGLMSVLATHLSTRQPDEFSECSFAILSREYMVLSLRMGYHFTTIEALCTPDAGKNYVRVQHKGGGASLDRRVRRVTLIKDLLSRLGFEHAGTGDFLNSVAAYLDPARGLDVLRRLGRITMLTKQLDIALSNDTIARWYTDDIARKLDL